MTGDEGRVVDLDTAAERLHAETGKPQSECYDLALECELDKGGPVTVLPSNTTTGLPKHLEDIIGEYFRSCCVPLMKA